MNSRVDQLDFQIGISSLQNIVLQKLQELNIAEVQFLRNFQTKVHYAQSHPFLVFYFRQLINHFQQNFKDVKSYFQDLKIQFLYDFFRKMQIIMINGVHFVSQALTMNIKQNQGQKQQQKGLLDVQKLLAAKNGQNAKIKLKVELEHFDKNITFFQNEERKINEEMQAIKQNIWMGKSLVEKLHASKAVKQLTQIKQISQDLLQNTQKIFEETYQLKFLEFKDYVAKIRQSEDISAEFCKNIQYSLRDRFSKGIQKTVNKIVYLKGEQLHSRQIDHETQTQDGQNINRRGSARKSIKQPDKLHHLFLKQRKNNESLTAKHQQLLKLHETTQSENNKLLELKLQLQNKLKETSENYQILTKLYQEKKDQILKQNIVYQQLQYTYNLQKNDQLCKRNIKVQDVSLQVHITSSINTDKQNQTQHFDNQTIVYLTKYISKLKINLSQYEKTINKMGKSNQKLKSQFQKEDNTNLQQQNGQKSAGIYDNNQDSNKKKNYIDKMKKAQMLMDPKMINDGQQEFIKRVEKSQNSLSSNSIKINADLPSDKDLQLFINNMQSNGPSSSHRLNLLSIRHMMPSNIQKQSVWTQTNQNGQISKAIQTQSQESIKNQAYLLNHKNKNTNISRNESKKQNYAANKTDDMFLKKKGRYQSNKTAFNVRNHSKILQNGSKEDEYGQIIYNDHPMIDVIDDMGEYYDNHSQLPRNTTFQSLNIDSQQSKSSLQKRKNLKKIIMMNLQTKRQKLSNTEPKYENKNQNGDKSTCSQGKSVQKLVSHRNLICVDKLELLTETTGFQRKIKKNQTVFRVVYKKNVGNTII